MAKKIRPSGGYRALHTFQTATVIYDATVWFCEKFVDPRSRTTDQMVQAARSGRQNIAEGSRASATSSHTELRLVNVACPLCGKAMVLRTAHTGKHAGKPFWGCSGYPTCKGVVNM